jgi:hypothetical protein
LRNETQVDHESDQDLAGSWDTHDTRFIKLDPKFTKKLTWSNDLRELDLYGAFKEGKPNLSSDFNVPGLRPILKEKHGDELWILQDTQCLLSVVHVGRPPHADYGVYLGS